MRVVHVINRFGWSGGAENQLSLNLSRFNDSRLEHVVLALFRDDDPVSERANPSVPVEYLVHESNGVGKLGLIRLLHKTLGELRPDLMHAALADAALGARLYALRTGTPLLESLVNISHDPVRMVDNPNVDRIKLAYHSMLDRATMRGVLHFHALSGAVARSWQKRVGLDPSRITVIPRGVETERFTPEGRHEARTELRSRLGLAPEARVVVAVARQEPQKGLRYLLEAMAAVVRDVPDAHLVLAGRKGNSTNELMRIRTDLALDSHVTWLDVIENIPGLLRAADCFAFPSLFEGLGVALLEAMSAGCACVASDIDALEEITDAGRTASLVPPRDSAALASAIANLLVDRDRASELGAIARARVVENFSIERSSADLEALYLRMGEEAGAV